MKKQKIAATVLGQSVVHITPHAVHISPTERRQIVSHLIGELKLITDEKRIVYVRCPINDGHIVLDEEGSPDHKLGMQLYNTLVCKHPFGSRRVIVSTEELRHGRPTRRFELSKEDPEALVRVERPMRPEKQEKIEKPPERPEKQEKIEKPPERPERLERLERRERNDRPAFNQQLSQQLAVLRQQRSKEVLEASPEEVRIDDDTAEAEIE